ncbi:LysR family transcriptional regulator [Aneurinibacillus tyrosinisolvens]|uniref:LysR family transcriptional regulator n=1 Tax=Aneurinibacillus tyrosinisolvens TaxID=1443435 RepID=UPI000A7A4410|nr:LysR family transcriptional regulator [Aneurinibacillus tyrosinisolvens]
MMDIEQLRAFVTLAQYKNFSKTAEALHLVQSTVSARIQGLERTVGSPLFVRDNRKVEITSTGRALLPYAERILLLSEESLLKIKSIEKYEDQLSIGATDSIWRYLLGPVLEDFYHLHPEHALIAKTGHSWDVNQHLSDGVVQLGFVYLPANLPGFDVIPFYEEEILLVAHPEHEAALLGEISKGQLSDIPLLHINWGSPFHEWITELLPLDFLPHLHIDNVPLILSFLQKGMGAGFMIKSAVQKELVEGTLTEIKIKEGMKPPKRTVFMVVHRDKLTHPSIEKWISIMKEHRFFTQ